MPIPLAVILAGLTAGGGILNRWMGTQDIKRQNLYNTPANQVRRLREAGLPYAAMTDAISGNQSQVPENPDFIKDGIGSYVQNTMMQKQLELLEVQIRKEAGLAEQAWKDAGLKANLLTRDNEQLQYDINAEGLDDMQFPSGIPPSNLVRKEVRQRKIAETELLSKVLDNELKGMEMKLKGLTAEEIGKRIEGIVINNAILRQTFNDNDLLRNFDRRVAIAIRENEGMSLKEILWMMIKNKM